MKPEKLALNPRMEPHSSEPPPSGVRPSFEHLFPFAHRYIRHSVHQLGVPDRDCDDVTQDVLIAVHRGLCKYDPTRPLKPWLKTIAYRAARDYRALSRNKREMLSPDVHAQITDGGLSPEEQLIRAQARRLLLEILHSVDLDRRVVFILHDMEDVSMDEIAESMKIPVNTARTRLRLARAQVQAALDRRKAQEKRKQRVGAALFPLGLVGFTRKGDQPPELPAEHHRRTWETLQRALSAPPAPVAGNLRSGSGNGLESAMSRLAPAKLAGAALLVFSLGAAAGAALMSSQKTPPPAIVDHAPSPSQMANPLPLSPSIDTPSPPERIVVAPPSEGPTTGPGPSLPLPAPRPDPATATDRLKKETRLIHAAVVGLDQGDLAGARSALNEYGRDFPRGELAGEYQTLLARLHALESRNAAGVDSGVQPGTGGP